MKNNSTQNNIPSGWKQATLGKVASVTNGSTNTQDAIADGGYPLFDRSLEIKRSNKYLFDDTAIILPGEGAEFVPRMYSGKFDLHQRAYAIFPDKNIVIPAYLYHFLYANRKTFVQKSVGSTVKSLRMPLIQSVDVSIPPFIEQQKIAEILGVVDEDIAKTQEVIEATEKLKRGLMQQLFTRGIGPTKFKKTKIGQIPQEWDVVPLGEVTKFIDYRGKTPKKTESGIPLITAKNVRRGYISIEPQEYIAESDYSDWMTRGIPKIGDVLFTTEAPLGYVAQIDTNEKIALAQRIITIQSDTLNHVFLKYMLTSQNIQNAIQALGTGGTVKGIKASVLKKLEVLQPSIKEQKEIADILSAVDEKILVNKKLKEKLTLLKKGLMQDLLSGNIRV